MNNMTEMRTKLTEVFGGLIDGTIPPKVASEVNNTAGKIIKSCAVQLEYQVKTKDKPQIEFLNCA